MRPLGESLLDVIATAVHLGRSRALAAEGSSQSVGAGRPQAHHLSLPDGKKRPFKLPFYFLKIMAINGYSALKMK